MEKLCLVDAKHHGVKAKAVTLLQRDFIAKINAPAMPDAGLTVAQFWLQHYLPHIERKLKPSTVFGYKKLWSGVLENHFGTKKLSEYKKADGYDFLLSLDHLSVNSLTHVRALCSQIFRHAFDKGLIQSNVWRDVAKVKGKESKETGHYTLDEAQRIIADLEGRLRAQTVFGLSFFCALRPGELAGLCWEDFDDDHVTVNRSVWHRVHITTPKTKQAVRTIPLIGPTKELVDAWRLACGSPTEGWLFDSGKGTPMDMSALAARSIKPVLGKRFKGLYSGRRGMSTALIDLTGSAVAAQGLLGHKDLSTTTRFYNKITHGKFTPGATARGMQEMNEKITEQKQ